MHSAPSVSYPVGRSRFHGALALLIGLLGGMTLLAWGLQADAIGVRHLASVLLWLVSSGLLAHQWRMTPVGVLAWDGAAWRWQQADQVWPIQPAVSLDLQTFMLLKLHTAHGPAWWVWPERQTAPAHWLALRRALFGQAAVGQTDLAAPADAPADAPQPLPGEAR